MRQHFLAAVLLVSSSNFTEPMIQSACRALGDGGPKVATLGSLHEKHRPLLIFAPVDNDLRYLDQARLLAGSENDLIDRQVLLVPLALTRRSASNGTVFPCSQVVEVSHDGASSARKRFGIAATEFAVILLGKDGGEKYRTHIPVTIDRLNSLIDAMPMRQQEVRNGHSK